MAMQATGSGEVSADAAGIIATLYALNGLANRTRMTRSSSGTC